MNETESLQQTLNELYIIYGRRYLSSDPLKFSHRYSSVEDREIAALISAVLAYGGVRQIFTSVEHILCILGDSPSAFIRQFDPRRDAQLFDGFVHRFNRGTDVALLMYYLKQVYESYPSLESFFLEGFSAEDETVEYGLVSFSERIFELDCSPFYLDGLPASAGVRFLISSPKNNSACKRMNLFLRWMVREKDGCDLGLWKNISPSKLVIPLDTHTSRICRYIGLTSRRNPSWKMALEVTGNLRRLDPSDPVKYDFALSRLGILDRCLHRYAEGICEECRLLLLCSKAQKFGIRHVKKVDNVA